jgi:hypothetical protein
MPYTRTLAQLRTAVQTVGSWEGSLDITPAVLLQAINYGLLRGYDAMVQRWEDYYTLNPTFAIVAGTDTYALATIAPNFYKLRHLDVSADGQRFIRCYPHDLDAAAMWSAVSQGDVRRVRYRVQGASLVFAPVPGAGTGKIYYIPLAPQLAADGDVVTFDVPAEEMLVVHLAARDMLVRSDLDTSGIEKLIGEDLLGLRTAADARDAGEPFYLNPRGPRRKNAWAWPEDDRF